jgi:hypothetical protein
MDLQVRPWFPAWRIWWRDEGRIVGGVPVTRARESCAGAHRLRTHGSWDCIRTSREVLTVR